MSRASLKNIQEKWSTIKFRDIVLSLQPGFACGKRDENGYVQLRMNNIGLEGRIITDSFLRVPESETNFKKYSLENGDVIFNNTNSPELVGKTVLFRGELNSCVYSNHLTRIRVNKDLTTPEFVTNFLRLEQRRGTFQLLCRRFVGQAAVPKESLLNLDFPLLPINEQKRIVSKIEELFKESKSAREALDKIPQIMKKFRQSVLAAAFRGELVSQDPNDESAEKLLDRIKQERRQKWEKELVAKGKDPKKFKYEGLKPVELEELSELPRGWTWSNIEFVTENHDGKRVPVNDKERQKMKGKYPYYGASGVIDSVNDFLFDGNYLLIGEDGANLLSRSTPIAFIVKGKFWVNNHAHVLTTLGGMPLEYLESYFNNIDLSRWVTGTAQPKLNQKRMNSIPIPIAPLKEQQRIIKKIQELFTFADQIEKSVEEAKKRADKIDQAILAKAFRGELVPQDPNDEPASVLLERISQDKELEIKPVKKTRRFVKTKN